MAGRRRGRRRRGRRADPLRRPDRSGEVESLFADRIAAGTEVTLRSRDRRRSAPPTAAGSARSCSPAARTAAPIRPRSRRPCSKASARTASTSCRGARRARRCAGAPPSPARRDPAHPRPVGRGAARSLDEWLPPLLAGKRRLADVDPGALDGLLGWEARKAIDRLAPSHFETPAGSRHPIDYDGRGRPDRHGPRPGAVRPRRASRRPATCRSSLP